jgi:hypothetical protein
MPLTSSTTSPLDWTMGLCEFAYSDDFTTGLGSGTLEASRTLFTFHTSHRMRQQPLLWAPPSIYKSLWKFHEIAPKAIGVRT